MIDNKSNTEVTELTDVVKLGDGGRVRIPKKIRIYLKWGKGQRVFVTADEQTVVFRKMRENTEKSKVES